MRVTEDGPQIKQACARRSAGHPGSVFIRKSSIDELPQLFNAIKGQMSLVGPRPHAIAHNEAWMLMVENDAQRHNILPGITGLAQANGFRGEADTPDKIDSRVKLDLKYIESELALDIQILAKTVAAASFTDRLLIVTGTNLRILTRPAGATCGFLRYRSCSAFWPMVGRPRPEAGCLLQPGLRIGPAGAGSLAPSRARRGSPSRTRAVRQPVAQAPGSTPIRFARICGLLLRGVTMDDNLLDRLVLQRNGSTDRDQVERRLLVKRSCSYARVAEAIVHPPPSGHADP